MFMPLKQQDEFGFGAGLLWREGCQPAEREGAINPKRDSNECENKRQ